MPDDLRAELLQRELARLQAAPGNINLFTRPRVANPDGSISTVRSMSFSEGGPDILVPTVGRHGGLLSGEDAIRQFHETGEHLGTFPTPEAATAYGHRLHDAYEQGDYDVPLASSRRAVDPDQLAAVLARLMQQGPTRGPR